MTRSEAGKLGAVKSKALQIAQYEARIIEYEKSPATCTFCQSKLPYNSRNNTFCGHSCAAAFNNKGVRRNCNPPTYCRNCNKEKGNNKNFCSHNCQRDHNYRNYIQSWLNGDESGNTKDSGISEHIRRWLKETNGDFCGKIDCGWDWNKPCVLEIEHKDGNSENSRPANVMLICPNCHSQTKTYKGKNFGNGRWRRRLRYAEGKSF